MRKRARMYQIQLVNKIASEALDNFPKDLYQVGEDFSNPDIIIARSKDLKKVEFGSKLKAVGRSGAGINNIPVDILTERGVAVFNTPGANANAVKELVLAGLLLSSRNLIPAASKVKEIITDNNDSKNFSETIESIKSKFKGVELRGKNIGIIGLGAIGVMVANTCSDMGMNVYGFDPLISVDNAWKLSSKIHRVKVLEDLVSLSDFITIHVPLVAETSNLIDKKLLDKTKKNCTLLNFSRGEIVDIDEVVNSINKGFLKYYVSDFPDPKIIDNERVIFFPHLGASTHESELNCAVMIVNQIRNFIEQGTLTNSVNLPESVVPNFQASRIVIVNRNIPSMVSKITEVMGINKININGLINTSKNEVAYNIIDFDGLGFDREKLTSDIKNIDGVLNLINIS
jgi:D-3-phosphoglycerate dehydrogenase